MLKCFSLAQADAHVTKEIIEVNNHPVEPLVQILSANEYREALGRNFALFEFDGLLRDAYQTALANNFSFKQDWFGGYGLFYVGEKTFQTRKSRPLQILPSIVGFIEKISSESLASFKDISIFRKTDACKFDRVMLGPTRFANHSCKPNCRFVLREVNSRRCIQLEILCPIEKNDDITVSYGNDFFGEGNQDCLCVHVNRHQTKVSLAERQRDSRPRLVLPSSRIR